MYFSTYYTFVFASRPSVGTKFNFPLCSSVLLVEVVFCSKYENQQKIRTEKICTSSVSTPILDNFFEGKSNYRRYVKVGEVCQN